MCEYSTISHFTERHSPAPPPPPSIKGFWMPLAPDGAMFVKVTFNKFSGFFITLNVHYVLSETFCKHLQIQIPTIFTSGELRGTKFLEKWSFRIQHTNSIGHTPTVIFKSIIFKIGSFRLKTAWCSMCTMSTWIVSCTLLALFKHLSSYWTLSWLLSELKNFP